MNSICNKDRYIRLFLNNKNSHKFGLSIILRSALKQVSLYESNKNFYQHEIMKTSFLTSKLRSLPECYEFRKLKTNPLEVRMDIKKTHLILA